MEHKLLDKPKQSIWRRLCHCCFSSEESNPLPLLDLTPTLINPDMLKIRNYASNRPYMIGRSSQLVSIFSHISKECEVSVAVKECPEDIPEKYWKVRHSIFSKFDQGVQVAEDSWEYLPYEKVTKQHIRNLVAEYNIKTVVDGLCGVGSYSILFSKCCEVIGIDIDPGKIQMARKNAEIYKTNPTFIEGDFFELSEHYKSDLVVLSPNYIPEELSIFDKFSPNIVEVIKAALRSADSILLILPRKIDPDDIAEVILQIPEIPLYVEFYLMFDSAHLISVSCLIGKLLRIPKSKVSLLIKSKLRINKNQAHLLDYAIKNTEFNHLVRSYNYVIQSPNRPFKEFFDMTLQGSPNVPVLVTGKDHELPKMILEYTFMYYKEADGEETQLNIDGNTIESVEEIADYLCTINNLRPTDAVELSLAEKTIRLIKDIHDRLEHEPESPNIKIYIETLSERVGKGFGTKKVNIADFYVMHLISHLDDLKLPATLEKYKNQYSSFIYHT